MSCPVSRPTWVSAAIAELLIGIYRRPWARLGPIPPAPILGTAMQTAVGALLALPDMPADIDPAPHPWWLGWWLAPAAALEPGEPVRLRLARSMSRIAAACGRALDELGDDGVRLLQAVADEWRAKATAGMRVDLGRRSLDGGTHA